MPIPNRGKLSARAVYAKKKVAQATEVKRGRGRPRKETTLVKKTSPKLNKKAPKSAVGRKRKIEPESNSSEADLSSEGEASTDTEVSKKPVKSQKKTANQRKKKPKARVEESEESDDEQSDADEEDDEEYEYDEEDEESDGDEEEQSEGDEESDDQDEEEESEVEQKVKVSPIKSEKGKKKNSPRKSVLTNIDENSTDTNEDNVRYSLGKPMLNWLKNQSKLKSGSPEKQKSSPNKKQSSTSKSKKESSTQQSSPKSPKQKKEKKIIDNNVATPSTLSKVSKFTSSSSLKQEYSSVKNYSRPATLKKQHTSSGIDKSERETNPGVHVKQEENNRKRKNSYVESGHDTSSGIRVKQEENNKKKSFNEKQSSTIKELDESSNADTEDLNDSSYARRMQNNKRFKLENTYGGRFSSGNQLNFSPMRYDNFYASSSSRILPIISNDRRASTSSSIDRKYNYDASSSALLGSPNFHVNTVHHLVELNKDSECGNCAADEAFHWLIHPIKDNDFFEEIFEKKPFHLSRNLPTYYSDLFSCKDLDTLLKENNLDYNIHLDVLKYVNGQRTPTETCGKAYYSTVWEDYTQGYSVRLRNPQTYHKKLWKLCALLQEYFSSTVGVNMYLTPPDAQGFPPHYDDIDAFIVQIEGSKHWKVYQPRDQSENLARYSSIDFKQHEIGLPLLEITLQAGDFLYIPRGYIHQAVTDHEHSLHLTLSTNQLNTWGDFLMPALMKAMERAMLTDVDFRKTVPRKFMSMGGKASRPLTREEEVQNGHLNIHLKNLAFKMVALIDADEALDSHALRFLRSSLPPVFNKIERQHSLHGNGSCWSNGNVRLKKDFDLNTEIQFMRKRNMRLAVDETSPKLYHNLENTRDPKSVEEENQECVFVDFDSAGIPSYQYLLKKFPEFVKIKDLPMDGPEEKIAFATSLYESGVLMTSVPLGKMT